MSEKEDALLRQLWDAQERVGNLEAELRALTLVSPKRRIRKRDVCLSKDGRYYVVESQGGGLCWNVVWHEPKKGDLEWFHEDVILRERLPR